jgi:hypothetical protein
MPVKKKKKKSLGHPILFIFVPMSTLTMVTYPSACSNVSIDIRQRFKIGHLIQDMHKAMRQYSTARRAAAGLFEYGDDFSTAGEWVEGNSGWVLGTAAGETLHAAIGVVRGLYSELQNEFPLPPSPHPSVYDDAGSVFEYAPVCSVIFFDPAENNEWSWREHLDDSGRSRMEHLGVFQPGLGDPYETWLKSADQLAQLGYCGFSELKAQWRPADRAMHQGLLRHRVAELHRLDAAFYGGPRLSTVQAMAVPLTELTAICRGHPQHGVPIEAALFVAGNAKRLRVR